MGLQSFKQLLLRKTNEDDVELRSVIEDIDSDELSKILIDSIEQLEKNKPGQNLGKDVHPALSHWLEHVDPDEIDMLRDAIGHHASHYKSALSKGDKTTADKHMSKLFRLMHLARRAEAHPHPKGSDHIQVSAPPPHHWEANAYDENDGWSRSSMSSTGKGKGYDWLRSPPHGERAKHIKRLSQLEDNQGVDLTGAYPIRNIKINDKYIPIEDVDNPGHVVDHPFDSHPIVSHHNKPLNTKSKDGRSSWWNQYEEKLDKWIDPEDPHPHLEEFREKLDSLPDDHGSTRADPVHESENKLDLEHAIKNPHMYPRDTTKKRKTARYKTATTTVPQPQDDKTTAPAAAPAPKPQGDKTTPVSDPHSLVHSAAKLPASGNLRNDQMKEYLDQGHISSQDIVDAGYDPSTFGIEHKKSE